MKPTIITTLSTHDIKQVYKEGMNSQYKAMNKAVATELMARADKDKEATPIKRGGLTLSANQWTVLVVGLFTAMAIVLNYFGLIQ